MEKWKSAKQIETERKENLKELKRLLKESKLKQQSMSLEESQWRDGYEQGLETAIEIYESNN